VSAPGLLAKFLQKNKKRNIPPPNRALPADRCGSPPPQPPPGRPPPDLLVPARDKRERPPPPWISLPGERKPRPRARAALSITITAEAIGAHASRCRSCRIWLPRPPLPLVGSEEPHRNHRTSGRRHQKRRD
jgi:hypothetical protein